MFNYYTNMESPMLKSKNPDKERPSKHQKRWTYEEETLLLEDLSKNIDIQLIAQSHNRTIGGINARRRGIAYELYNNNHTMEEIILKTKLDEDQIIKTIKRRQNNPKKCKTITGQFSIEIEINEMKNDIKELKNTVKELVEMMNAVYEFEDA